MPYWFSVENIIQVYGQGTLSVLTHIRAAVDLVAIVTASTPSPVSIVTAVGFRITGDLYLVSAAEREAYSKVCVLPVGNAGKTASAKDILGDLYHPSFQHRANAG